ncbi:tyrosine-type recombinase/integrase [Pantanalinema sp. GBBB05]|uniref:tyrosine-type recombinase/integrase n=1 Tax=Pantanalinema sp. GBBB05 TaxID=2604139 RepID=UPI001DF81D75|nr:phage integrase family protein [Pantanalinema sp. GBBB05]
MIKKCQLSLSQIHPNFSSTVKKLGKIAGVEDINPHRFRHTFGTEVTRRGVDPLFGKELMGIKRDRIFQRYTKGVFKQAAAEAYLKAIGEEEGL